MRLLQLSNALMHLAYRQLAVLTGWPRRMVKVTDLYASFETCLPMSHDLLGDPRK
jgi:hypothetical protein